MNQETIFGTRASCLWAISRVRIRRMRVEAKGFCFVFMIWIAMQSFAIQSAVAQAISPEATQHWNAPRAAETQKDFKTAVSEYRKVTELDRNSAAGFAGLVQCCMEAHDFAAALSPLKRALQLDSTLLAAHQLLGYALLAQGYAAESIPHLERVHEEGALGIAQLETGQFADAIKNLQAALQKRPNDPDLLYYLGRAAGLLSKQSIDTLLALYPDSGRAHQSLAENYFVLRQIGEAEKEYEQSL